MLPQAKAAKEESIRQDVAGILRPFYCELCAKQYKKASEFEAHLGSYDHHHKKRLRELREAESNRAKEERQRREQKREEREMAKAQEMAVQAAAVAAAIAAPTPRSEWKTGGEPGAAPDADGIRAQALGTSWPSSAATSATPLPASATPTPAPSATPLAENRQTLSFSLGAKKPPTPALGRPASATPFAAAVRVM